MTDEEIDAALLKLANDAAIGGDSFETLMVSVRCHHDLFEAILETEPVREAFKKLFARAYQQ